MNQDVYRAASLVLVFCGLAACTDETDGVTFGLYAEGTGQGDIRIENDEGQVILGSMDATSTMEGQLAKSSQVSMTATPRAGSVFAGFGGACAGGTNPFSFQIDHTMTCSVRFDAK